MDVILVYLSGMKNAHSSLRFESLSKAETSVARLVLVATSGGEDRIFFPLIEQNALSIKSWDFVI